MFKKYTLCNSIMYEKIFGKGKNVGTASIGFDVINSKEWQDKKKEVIEKLKTRGISIDTNKENAKQVTEK